MSTSPPPKPYAGTQVLQRALRLLDLFSDERPSWNVSALAREARLNRTTTYRLMSVLEAAEWVARDAATEEYRLGSGLIALGARAGRANRLRTIARPLLAGLAETTGETVTLEILSQDDVVIIDEIDSGERYLGAAPDVGTRWPAHATSTGKVFLAFLPDAGEAIGLLAPLTPHTITDPSRLQRELAKIRELGYAVARDELELGYTAVGAPIFDATGHPAAAISAGGSSARLTGDKLAAVIELVAQTGRRISHALGFR